MGYYEKKKKATKKIHSAIQAPSPVDISFLKTGASYHKKKKIEQSCK